ncbi:SOS response-associated peptidase [Eubacterium limosum]|uniref:SOS response-associated peptidase n=1 Tax=Eubacterium limosum TaxID=1736 RepID=UPI0010638811|nr:SOS response-associated peptidase [Eubacterium limosum]
MCGRYVLYSDKEQAEIREIIEEVNRKHNFVVKKGDVYPSNLAPIYAPTPDQNGKSLEVMKWGYEVSFRKGLLINARSETILEKKTFKKDFLERRCIVPASGFYEWDKEKNKYIFQAQDDEALYIVGVFREHENASEYVILTKAPVEPVVAIHDRMPVIIPHSKAEEWLYDDNAAMGIVTQNYVPLDCQMAEK